MNFWILTVQSKMAYWNGIQKSLCLEAFSHGYKVIGNMNCNGILWLLSDRKMLMFVKWFFSFFHVPYEDWETTYFIVVTTENGTKEKAVGERVIIDMEHNSDDRWTLFLSYPTNHSVSLFSVSGDQDVAYDGTFKATGFHILYPIVLFFKNFCIPYCLITTSQTWMIYSLETNKPCHFKGLTRHMLTFIWCHFWRIGQFFQ